MAQRIADNKLLGYKCGRCGHEVLYRKSQTRPTRCTECGTKGTGDYDPSSAWRRGTQAENDVPGSFKFNLKQFS